MFSLTDAELDLRIIGCADGPASFNAQMARMGRRVISCDPLYQLSGKQIEDRIAEVYPNIIEEARRDQHRYLWDRISSADELGRLRMAAMRDFLGDYDAGRVQGRYLAAQLPELPFASHVFDIALCSHFLFLYSDEFSLEFHCDAVTELCRVAREVRIFPLLKGNGERSPFVGEVVELLKSANCSVAIEKVDYEFQRGGNQMLRISTSR